jgi:hypothetical protein
MKRSRRDYPCGCPGGVYTDVLQFFFQNLVETRLYSMFFFDKCPLFIMKKVAILRSLLREPL